MQKMAIMDLQPGMVTAQNIFSTEGVLLLGTGTKLTSDHIERLQHFCLASAYIEWPRGNRPASRQTIREETRTAAIKVVHTAFHEALATRRIDSEQLKKTVALLIDEITKNDCVMIHLTDIRSRDSYTFGHSVNVCVLSILTGVRLGYNLKKLKELALGALLHDIGKMLIPKEILLKPGALTAYERKIMGQHPAYGFDILRDQSKIPLTAALVAYQHHEKFNGKGYPRKSKNSDLHEYTRIVAVADVYDAIASNRPYKEALLPHEAYEITASLATTYFDPVVIKTFLSLIAIYPLGCIVRVNTGEIAEVIHVIPGLQTRPILKAIFDADGNRLNDGHEIDLTKQLTVFIDRIYTPVETLQLAQV